jgi:hypothetical protein
MGPLPPKPKTITVRKINTNLYKHNTTDKPVKSDMHHLRKGKEFQELRSTNGEP